MFLYILLYAIKQTEDYRHLWGFFVLFFHCLIIVEFNTLFYDCTSWNSSNINKRKCLKNLLHSIYKLPTKELQ